MRALLRITVISICLYACGNTTKNVSSGGPDATGDAGGDAAARMPTLLDATSLPEACTSSFYRTTFDGVTTELDATYVDGPVWRTSWDSFRVYAQALPTENLNGVWAVGPSSEPFVDREFRTLDTTLIFASGRTPELLCAGGERRVVKSGDGAHVLLTDLGPLRCSDEPVTGELVYCDDCYNGGAAIQGTLDGESILDRTGSRTSIGSLIYFRLGFSVLAARTRTTGDNQLALEAGAYLSLSEKLYCIGAASGSLADGGIGTVTFTNFTRAEPCSASATAASIEICSPRFTMDEDW